jgi:hypothetical protein
MTFMVAHALSVRTPDHTSHASSANFRRRPVLVRQRCFSRHPFDPGRRRCDGGGELAFRRRLQGPLLRRPPWTPVSKLNDLHLRINDGLVAVFFFVVGLEVKREVVSGSLSDPAARRLPMLAAAAGMAAPAIVFIFIVGRGELESG